jgi:hypothetical protein
LPILSVISVWLLIYIGVLVQIDSRILVLASTGQGNLQKKSPCPETSRSEGSAPRLD